MTHITRGLHVETYLLPTCRTIDFFIFPVYKVIYVHHQTLITYPIRVPRCNEAAVINKTDLFLRRVLSPINELSGGFGPVSFVCLSIKPAHDMRPRMSRTLRTGHYSVYDQGVLSNVV